MRFGQESVTIAGKILRMSRQRKQLRKNVKLLRNELSASGSEPIKVYAEPAWRICVVVLCSAHEMRGDDMRDELCEVCGDVCCSEDEPAAERSRVCDVCLWAREVMRGSASAAMKDKAMRCDEMQCP